MTTFRVRLIFRFGPFFSGLGNAAAPHMKIFLRLQWPSQGRAPNRRSAAAPNHQLGIGDFFRIHTHTQQMGKSRKKDTSRVPSAKCFISTGTCPIDCSASQPTDLPHIPVAGSEADAAPPAKRPKTSGHASTKNAPNHRLSSKTQHKIPRTIETHNFANCARLVVPTSVVPLIQKCAIDDGPVIFYYRLRCTIGDILLSDFLSSYIKNSKSVIPTYTIPC